MIVTLDTTNRQTAQQILDVQIPAYKIEAELIGFDGIPQLNDTIDSLRQSGEIFLGYIRDEELIGCLAYKETENEIDICRLIVHPAHFRKGVAKSLLTHLLNRFKDKQIVVSTGTKNVPAITLYK